MWRIVPRGNVHDIYDECNGGRPRFAGIRSLADGLKALAQLLAEKVSPQEIAELEMALIQRGVESGIRARRRPPTLARDCNRVEINRRPNGAAVPEGEGLFVVRLIVVSAKPEEEIVQVRCAAEAWAILNTSAWSTRLGASLPEWRRLVVCAILRARGAEIKDE